MKANIKLLAISTFAALVLTGCEKSTEPKTESPAANAAPEPAKPDAVTPLHNDAGASVPAVPANTNNPAVTNQ